MPRFKLPDDRRLAFKDQGPPNGRVLIHHHGTGSSRLESPHDDLLYSHGVRLITLDRPGHGRSGPVGKRPIIQWSRDVFALLNNLQIEVVYLSGFEQGCAFALALAAAAPERVDGLTLLSPTALPNSMSATLKASDLEKRGSAGPIEQLKELITWSNHRLRPEHVVRKRVAAGPPEERALLDQPEVMVRLAGRVHHGYAQGPAGPLTEKLALRSSWGFELSDVHPKTLVLCGDQDPLAPPELGERLVKYLPNASLELKEGQGALLLLRNWPLVLGHVEQQPDRSAITRPRMALLG